MHARFLHLLQAVMTVWVLVLPKGYYSAALVYTYIDITAVMDLIIQRSLSVLLAVLLSLHHVTLTINIMVTCMLKITTVDGSLVWPRPFM